VLDAGDMVQKALDLIGGEDDGEFIIQAGAGEVMLLPSSDSATEWANVFEMSWKLGDASIASERGDSR
jgi:hypothetical protein